MPLLWISFAFFVGLLAGAYLPLANSGWLILAGVSLLGWPGCHWLPARGRLLVGLRWLGQIEPRLRIPPLLLLVFLFLGAWRFGLANPDLDHGHIAAYNDQGRFQMVGVLDAAPDRRDRSTQLRVRIEQVAPLDANGMASAAVPAHGVILALALGQGNWQYGDRLQLEGSPVTPPEDEDFSYRDYLSRQGVYTYLTYPGIKRLGRDAGNPLMAEIYHLRDWANAEIYHLYPAPEAPLLAGILLGNDNDLPEDLARAFQDTGTAHIIAISGFNFAILLALFSTLFGKLLPRWWALLLAVLTASGYAILVGATPSVVRAAIMGSLSLLAHQIGRRSAGVNTLCFTAALMCLFNPQLPWDASFQLSFGATLGLLVYGDRFQQGFMHLLEKRFSPQTSKRIAGPVSEYVLLTLAAQVMTLPIILYHFQRLSLSSLLANPLVLPPQPLVMVLSGLAVLAGAVSDPLAHLLAWLAWPLSAYTIRMVEVLASLPGGVVTFGEMNLGTLALMYAVVFAPLVSSKLPGMLKSQVQPTLVLVGTGLLAALLLRAAAAAPDGRLQVVVIDNTGSPAVLIRGPGGETMLINGGPSARQLNDTLGRWLSPLDRHLDGLLLTDASTSALGSLPTVLERYPPDQAWWACDLPANRSSQSLPRYLQNQQIASSPFATGSTLTIHPQVSLESLGNNGQGSALLLQMDQFRALIPGGVAPGSISPENLANLSLLLLEPRDLKDTAPEDWLAFTPQVIIAIPGNLDWLPSELNWRNTHPGGWYHITSDGARMWIEGK